MTIREGSVWVEVLGCGRKEGRDVKTWFWCSVTDKFTTNSNRSGNERV